MFKMTLKMAGMVVAVILGSASSALATGPGPTPIPEPSLLMLVAGGIGGAILYARSRRAGK